MTALATIFQRFPKFHENLSEGQTNIAEHFPKFPKISEDAQRFPKIAEDFQGTPEDVSILHQQIKEKFKRQT